MGTYAVLSGLSIVLHLAGKVAHNAQPTWAYLTFSGAIGVMASVTLLRLKTAFTPAIVQFSSVGILSVTGLLLHEIRVDGDYASLLPMYHIGIFTTGLILGFKGGLHYAVTTIIILTSIILAFPATNEGALILAIGLAAVAAAPAKVIEQIVEENTAKLELMNRQMRQEIAHREQVERALRKSEAYYRSLIQTSPDAITVTDLGGVIQLSTPQSSALHLAIQAEDLVGTNAFDLVAPEDRARAYEYMRRTLEHGSVHNIEYQMRRLDGTQFPAEISASVICDADGNPEAFVGVTRDISERKRTEAAIKQRNQELVILNAISTGINRARTVEEIFDVTLDQVLEVTGLEIGWMEAPPADRGPSRIVAQVEAGALLVKQLRAQIARSVRRTGAPVTITHRSPPSKEPWTVVGVPILSRDEVLGVFGIAGPAGRPPFPLDEETRRLLVAVGHQIAMGIENARLVRQAAEVEILREVNQLRAELIANFSHNLRSPLGIIKMSCSTLLRDDVDFDAATQRELLEDIEEQTDRLADIVDNVLHLSRVESGRIRLHRRSVDLHQLTRDVVRAMKMRLQQHRVIQRFPEHPLMADVDPQRIEEVLRNLLDNAVKYSPDGGTITIAGVPHEDHVLIRVRDEGIGIPPDALEKIFERFYRVPDERTQQVNGTGLGLAVCRGIVTAHGGEIWAECHIGGGSVFSFTLPAATPDATTPTLP
jgi:two-component system sensor histidine kinase KdpD